MLVIADAERPVAVAGIMGGSGAEVTYSTHDILLEAACFDPVSIRRTSRKLGLSSESSYRFERKVDRENVPYASDRALGLIMEIAGGRPEEFIDIETAPVKAAKIMLSCGRLNSLLGTDISPAKIRKVASGLGMKVTGSGAQTLKIQAPSFRQDIKGEVDVIEEIARVNGYDKIPSTLPRIVEQPVRVEPAMARRDLIRDALAALGVDEIMTYSLIDRKTATALEDTQDGMVEVKNPLTSEQEVMRPSLIPGMLGAIAWNINRKSRDLRFYELGNVYSMKGGPDPREELRLSIGISGSAFSSWAGGSRESGFFEL
jgi:phenylalanyl-tRNA synthetase beta chain